MSSSSPSSPAWEPPLPEELQRMLPQYEISGILGRGGMGAVYKGRQAKLNRAVAIKVLPETFTKGEDQLNFAKRFEQEAQAMANLDHPAILSVYDFGETAEGQLYFVMEFIDGMDIHEYLKIHGGRLPQTQALAITAHVLDALEYAHHHGIVHRDIKPANILLNHEGRVKIADFGLAKKFGDHADENAPALTMSNLAVGTPDFVAPEALDGDHLPDHRADLYAVGVMLYQMLTGRLPRGNFQMPSELNSEVDPRLDEIVGKAMATNPENRYPSAGAVRADLDRVLSQPISRIEAGDFSGAVAAAVPVTASVRGVKRAKKRSDAPLMLGIGAAVVLLVGLVVITTRYKGEAESDGAFPPTTSAVTTSGGPPAKPNGPASPGSVTTSSEEGKPAIIPMAPADKTVQTSAPVPQMMGTPRPVAASHGVVPAEATVMTPPLSDPLANLPGLQTRLNRYLASRKMQLTELATTYGRNLDSRLNRAADSGDLKLTTAFDEEKAKVAALVASLAIPVTDPREAVSQLPVLPDLPDGSPDTLVTLRQTWMDESGKICATLDAALQHSLLALEGELTKARDLDKARAVLAFREALASETSVVASGGPAPRLPSEPNGTEPAAGAAALQPSPDLARATKDAPYENSLGMKFVPVKDTDVLFAIHEVRYKDYAAYAAEVQGVDGSWRDQRGDGFAPTDRPEEHPVMKVNWEDAQGFCDWLSRKEGKRYRLPSDREWSVAAGIGRAEKWRSDTTPATVFKEPTAFPWGEEWPPPKGVGNYSDIRRKENVADARYLEGYDDGFPATSPVMSFEPCELGLYDLSGNVWEWCEDWHDDAEERRVLRGGSWNDSVYAQLLSSNRFSQTPAYRNGIAGFRVVVEIAVPLAAPPAATTPLVNRPAPASTAQQTSRIPPELARATKDAPYENSLGMKFVPVPDTGVLFCIHETRYQDYAAYAAEVAGVDVSWKDQGVDGFTPTDRNEEHPVMRVSWHEAKAFCDWLSKKEGRTYRLPTDREWSIAVGIGRVENWNSSTRPADVYKDPNAFPWGDEWPPPKGAGNYSDESRREKAPHPEAKYVDGYEDTFPTTAPVMSFEPNKIGLYDLGGNVWEWVEDWFSHEDKERVLRGGSWSHIERQFLLSSSRAHQSPDNRRGIFGFRIVLEVAAAPAPLSVAAPVSPTIPPPVVSTSNRVPKDGVVNSLGMNFVPVTGTDVLFCIHETRYRDYAAYASEAAGVDGSWKDQRADGFTPTDRLGDHPVIKVSWNDARAFCAWLGRKEGRTYRLPTDREWSIAAGIGWEEKWKSETTPANVFKDPNEFLWGDEWPPPKEAGNYSDESRRMRVPNAAAHYLDGYDDTFPTTAPVMSFHPGKSGLYDLGGNVWEWTDDWYDKTNKGRVVRGGCWYDGERSYLLSSHRSYYAPVYRSPNIGFRVVLVRSNG